MLNELVAALDNARQRAEETYQAAGVLAETGGALDEMAQRIAALSAELEGIQQTVAGIWAGTGYSLGEQIAGGLAAVREEFDEAQTMVERAKVKIADSLPDLVRQANALEEFERMVQHGAAGGV